VFPSSDHYTYLAYSCVNLHDEYMSRVSRDYHRSQTSQDHMNKIIELKNHMEIHGDDDDDDDSNNNEMWRVP